MGEVTIKNSSSTHVAAMILLAISAAALSWSWAAQSESLGIAGAAAISWFLKFVEAVPREHLVWGLCAGWAISTLLVLAMVMQKQGRNVYIVDFACYKPDDKRKCPAELMEYFAKRLGVYTDKTMDFFKKVYLKSGVGDETYAPPSMFQHPKADLSWKQARVEAEEVIFGAVDQVLAKTGVSAKDIGILIVNSSCFTPTPSLSSMVVNHYKMGTGVRTFNLGGMGCSAGLIAIDLAKDLLGMHPNTYALVVSTENITHNLYLGNYRPMLVTNCLFRVGGAAILLTNIRAEKRRAKYQLLHTVRIHNGADDKAYNCIMQEADSEGVIGVNLTKHIMLAAADALKKNLTQLGPLVLPFSEQLRFAMNVLARRYHAYYYNNDSKNSGKISKPPPPPYIPDFKLAFDHFLLHAGGRAVVDELQKSLRLSDPNMEPCRMTLYRFGNTSSSCVWYELAYVEAKGAVRKNQKLWQLGVGSGFKCNSAVWKALRDIRIPPNSNSNSNPWLDCIADYPVDIPTDMEDVPRRENLYFHTVDGRLVNCKTGEVFQDDHDLNNNHNNGKLNGNGNHAAASTNNNNKVNNGDSSDSPSDAPAAATTTTTQPQAMNGLIH